MKVTGRRLAVLLVFLAGLAPLSLSYAQSTPQQQPEPTHIKVMLNWNPQFQFAGFFAALNKGFYKQKNLNVEIVPWRPGHSVMHEVLNGQVDIGVANNAILLDLVKGKPLQLLMSSFQYSPLILLSHKPVNTLADLSGKTVMHNGSIQIKILLEKSLQLTGNKISETPSSGNIEDFNSNKVDLYGAYASNEPFVLQRQGHNFFVVDPKTFGVQSYDGLVFTSNDFANSVSPEVLHAFKQATIEGWRYALGHKNEISGYIKDHYSINKQMADLLNEADALADFIAPLPDDIGNLNAVRLQQTLFDASKLGLITPDALSRFDINSHLLFSNQATNLSNSPTLILIKEMQSVDWTKVLSSMIFLLVLSGLLLLWQKRRSYLKQIYELSMATTINFQSREITETSDQFCHFSGYSRAELIGKNYLSLASSKISNEQVQAILSILNSGKAWRGEIPALKKSGEEYWLDLTLTPRRNWRGKVKEVLATRIDITDKKRLEAISTTDELTGLYNRRHFNDQLHKEINRARRDQHYLSVIMLDIDHFKWVNDTYGHDIGDEVLVEIATSLHSFFHRAHDSVYRIGGEEFTVITRFDSAKAMEAHINRLLFHVRSLNIENINAPLKVVTLSAGGVFFHPSTRILSDEVVKLTDTSLYEAKMNGRNQFIYKCLGMESDEVTANQAKTNESHQPHKPLNSQTDKGNKITSMRNYREIKSTKQT